MKKTLSIILVVMMLMSLFTTTAFAACFNSYVVSNVEGFEAGKGGEGGGGTTYVAYPNITSEIGTHPGSSSDNTKVMKVMADTDDRKTNGEMVVGKVVAFNKASYFEEGATYKYTAWVKYVPNSTVTATEISFKIYPLKENLAKEYPGSSQKEVKIPVNEWVKVESNPFTYSNTKGQTFANLRTQLNTATGSPTDYDVYYVDDVKLEKCEDGFIPGKKYDFEEFKTVDDASMFTSYNGKDYVIEKPINNYPYITSIDNQKALKMKTSNNGYNNLSARYLFKMFGTKDVGKNYKVTMKIKAVLDNPNNVANVGTGTPRVFVGIKKNTGNEAGYGANYYPDRTVTASGSVPKYFDISYDNWTDVEFYVNPQTDYNYISFSLEGSNTPVANAPMYICVDDILAEEIPELPNKSIFEKNVVQDFESVTNLVKGKDYLVESGGVVELEEGTQSDGTTGKYLKLTNAQTYTRNHLIGFINSTDVGKYYKLTMDIKADQTTNVKVGFKTSQGSQTGGFAQGSSTLSVDETWKTVSFDMAIVNDATYGVTDRLCFNQATIGAIIYVDNIYVEPISPMSIFHPGTTYDFTNNGSDIHTGTDSETDNARFYESTDYSIENYFDNIPTVTSGVDSQNSLRLKMSNNSYTHRKGRYTLKFFGKEDFGKFYRVSMKVKAVSENPNKVDKVGTGTPLVCIGLKGYNGTATKANYGDNYYNDRTFKKSGTTPVATSLAYDAWTNVELYVKPESGRDGICFSLENCAVANAPMYIYIDDLRVEEAVGFTPYESLFKGLADPTQTKTFDIDGTAYSTLALGTDFTSGGDYNGGLTLETDAENNKYLKLGSFAADTKNNKRVKLIDVFSNAQLNETYRVSFKLKTAGTNADNLIYYGVMSDEDYSTKCQLSKTIGNTDWTSVEFIYTVTNDSKGNKMDEIFVEQLSKGSVEYVLLDELVIEPVNNAYAISNYYTDQPQNNDKMFVKAKTDTRADSADLIIIAVYSDDAEQNLISAGVASYDADASLLTALLNNYNQIDSVKKIKVFYLNNNGDVISSTALSTVATDIAK